MRKKSCQVRSVKIAAVHLRQNQLSKWPNVPRVNSEPRNLRGKDKEDTPPPKDRTIKECIVLVFFKTLVFYALFLVLLNVRKCPVHYGTIGLLSRILGVFRA